MIFVNTANPSSYELYATPCYSLKILYNGCVYKSLKIMRGRPQRMLREKLRHSFVPLSISKVL